MNMIDTPVLSGTGPKTTSHGTGLEAKYEKIPLQVFPDAAEGSVYIAQEIAKVIRDKQSAGEKCVLGLATGSSPKRVYAELIRLHKEEGLDFSHVVTFNLDEYYPMEPDSLQSYVRYMRELLFDHVNIAPENAHVPDGTMDMSQISEYCEAYEKKIDQLGGIDLQLLGIGHNGHIGFNESGSLPNSKTRMVALDHSTRAAASGDFKGLVNTPRLAITLGVKKIMEAKRVILMAWGEGKANIVYQSVEGEVNNKVPASFLQEHEQSEYVLDPGSAMQLTRVKTPWLVDRVEWTPYMTKKAVVHLALTVQKPVLMLTDADYNQHGMNDLVTSQGPAYQINIDVFNQLQHTITGWPGGKPNADDTQRPERAKPAKKRALIFSPHPDDDIISMGGTFIRLHEQGHDVHVAYQTSGNIAVQDDEAIRFADFVADYCDEFGLNEKEARKLLDQVHASVANKKSSEEDSAAVRTIKGMIRRGEAKATCRFVGLPAANAHFMNMPFYETGRVEKKPLGEEDFQITVDLIRELKPHQIYAAGDLADPHGTHKVCLDAVMEAVRRLKDEPWMKDCWVWLYRGAWQEWDIEQIEMAVPMSPDQVLQKRNGIFKHQSQKDGVVFQGEDSREFWQRAEERNSETAKLYDQLGLSQYAAMEAFVRWEF